MKPTQMSLPLEPVADQKTHDIRVFRDARRIDELGQHPGNLVEIDVEDMEVWSFNPNTGTGIARLGNALVRFKGREIRR